MIDKVFVDTNVAYKFSMWDAQIWAAAKLNQIEFVFSEDFNPGAMIEGVRFINPFLPIFAWKNGYN